MRIAYADESGRDRDFYFIGVLIADDDSIRAVHAELDRLGRMVAASVPEFDPDTEFHGYDLFHGKQGWADVPAPLRARASVLAIQCIAASGARFIFRGIDLVTLERRYQTPFPAHELTLAQALENADEFLEKENASAIVVADEHHAAEDGRRRFRRMTLGPDNGYSTRRLTQLVDTLYFGPSHHSRLLQAADLATFFSNRLRTVRNPPEAARKALARIEAGLGQFTARAYVWR